MHARVGEDPLAYVGAARVGGYSSQVSPYTNARGRDVGGPDGQDNTPGTGLAGRTCMCRSDLADLAAGRAGVLLTDALGTVGTVDTGRDGPTPIAPTGMRPIASRNLNVLAAPLELVLRYRATSAGKSRIPGGRDPRPTCARA